MRSRTLLGSMTTPDTSRGTNRQRRGTASWLGSDHKHKMAVYFPEALRRAPVWVLLAALGAHVDLHARAAASRSCAEEARLAPAFRDPCAHGRRRQGLLGSGQTSSCVALH
ncbi:hypothetical protein MAPG_02073 [Magnaporthiopsis poae ATCC 64411]|uniref:Uncharacterized protein n=1 Tax=Magnaporthiopsis poae (strain ATCC 64411 / 73-15) TaxID=644358 RepID=A0A0C4DQD4_MAGP6|nr:hypothetical protein MAPG_02073 [Magnaporthiopsis poae ATCC 64411]